MLENYVFVDQRINQCGVMSTPVAISRFLISLNELRGSDGNLPNGNAVCFPHPGFDYSFFFTCDSSGITPLLTKSLHPAENKKESSP